MKKFLRLITAVLLLYTSEIFAEDINWYRVTANALVTADWLQTQEIASNVNYIETNRILGEQPTNGDVNRFFITKLLLVNIVGGLLPEQYSDMFYITVSVDSGYFVVNNYMLGVRIEI